MAADRQDLPLLKRRPPWRRRGIGRLMLAVLAAGLAWRVVRYAVGFPLWGDEAFVAVNIIERDFAGMLRPLEHAQIAPLGFLWAELAVARVLGHSEYALRLLPFAGGVAGLLLFWRFAAAALGRRTALLAVAILAVAFYPVRHCTEVKPYAGDLLVSLILTALAWRVHLRPGSSRRWAALTAVAAAAVWVSYPAALVAGGVGIFLLGDVLHRRAPRRVVPLGIYAAVVGASFAATCFLYAHAQAAASPWYTEIDMWTQAFPPVAQPWRLPWWFLTIHTGNMMAYPCGGKNFGSTFTFLMVVVGCVALWRGGRGRLMWLLLAPLVPTFIAAAMRKYPYGGSARISLYVAPAFCLLAGAGMGQCLRWLLPKRLVLKGFGVAAAAIMAGAVVGIAEDSLHPYKFVGDVQNRDAIRQIVGQTAREDRWIVFNSIGGAAHAPALGPCGGEGARFRFYVDALSPCPVLWSPRPEQVRPVTRTIWLLRYRHYGGGSGDELLRSYIDVLAGRLGPPAAVERFELASPHPKDHPGPGVIEIYKFPPGGATDARTRSADAAAWREPGGCTSVKEIAVQWRTSPES